jgi:hypothetical protein
VFFGLRGDRTLRTGLTLLIIVAAVCGSPVFAQGAPAQEAADLKALEQKLLQFPAGSTFSVAHTGVPGDGYGDWTDISTFLESHGYSFKD